MLNNKRKCVIHEIIGYKCTILLKETLQNGVELNLSWDDFFLRHHFVLIL